MNIGQKIYKYRRKMEITQAQLGKELNISSQAISNWERNITEPDISSLNKLAKVFNISVNELIGDSEKTNNEKEDKKLEEENNVNSNLTNEKNHLLGLFQVLAILIPILTIISSIITFVLLKDLKFIWINIGLFIISIIVFVIYMMISKNKTNPKLEQQEAISDDLKNESEIKNNEEVEDEI